MVAQLRGAEFERDNYARAVRCSNGRSADIAHGALADVAAWLGLLVTEYVMDCLGPCQAHGRKLIAEAT